jgi:acyl carrier protein
MADIPADLEDQLLGWVREKFVDAGDSMTVETDLFEAGLDSMGIMQLLILIEERCGVRVTEAAVTRENFATARKLATLVRQCAGPA